MAFAALIASWTLAFAADETPPASDSGWQPVGVPAPLTIAASAPEAPLDLPIILPVSAAEPTSLDFPQAKTPSRTPRAAPPDPAPPRPVAANAMPIILAAPLPSAPQGMPPLSVLPVPATPPAAVPNAALASAGPAVAGALAKRSPAPVELIGQVDLLLARRSGGPEIDVLQSRAAGGGGLLGRVSARSLGRASSTGVNLTLGLAEGSDHVWEGNFLTMNRFQRTETPMLPATGAAETNSLFSPYVWPGSANGAAATGVSRWTSLGMGARNLGLDNDFTTASRYAGWRYHYFRDGIATANGAGGEHVGFAAENHLLGPEWGGSYAEHFGPLTLGVRGAVSGYVNFFQAQGRFESFAGTGSLAADASFAKSRSALSVAAGGQAGAFARMRWTQCLSVDAGWDINVLAGLAFGAGHASPGFAVPGTNAAGGTPTLAPGPLNAPKNHHWLVVNTLRFGLRWDF